MNTSASRCSTLALALLIGCVPGATTPGPTDARPNRADVADRDSGSRPDALSPVDAAPDVLSPVDDAPSIDVTPGGDVSITDPPEPTDASPPRDSAPTIVYCAMESDCGEHEACHIDECGVRGTCFPLARCPPGGAPECGCDGVLYQNGCMRRNASVGRAVSGLCVSGEHD